MQMVHFVAITLYKNGGCDAQHFIGILGTKVVNVAVLTLLALLCPQLLNVALLIFWHCFVLNWGMRLSIF